jgi:DNA-binding transcriptional regulator YdaS (Cro superfamily)
MLLHAYLAPIGSCKRLAEAIGVFPSMVSQWSTGVRAVPENHAPAIEFHTGFLVPVEVLCPDTRWQRVPDPAWPNGKPLIDKTPQPVEVSSPPDVQAVFPTASESV